MWQRVFICLGKEKTQQLFGQDVAKVVYPYLPWKGKKAHTNCHNPVGPRCGKGYLSAVERKNKIQQFYKASLTKAQVGSQRHKLKWP